MNSLFQIFGACLHTLATMNSLFQIFGACLRTLATMTSKKLRLPAHFSYNDFKEIAPACAL
jgi:hypothetical protein